MPAFATTCWQGNVLLRGGPPPTRAEYFWRAATPAHEDDIVSCSVWQLIIVNTTKGCYLPRFVRRINKSYDDQRSFDWVARVVCVVSAVVLSQLRFLALLHIPNLLGAHRLHHLRVHWVCLGDTIHWLLGRVAWLLLLLLRLLLLHGHSILRL